jgi:hypothetical protein
MAEAPQGVSAIVFSQVDGLVTEGMANHRKILQTCAMVAMPRPMDDGTRRNP